MTTTAAVRGNRSNSFWWAFGCYGRGNFQPQENGCFHSQITPIPDAASCGVAPMLRYSNSTFCSHRFSKILARLTQKRAPSPSFNCCFLSRNYRDKFRGHSTEKQHQSGMFFTCLIYIKCPVLSTAYSVEWGVLCYKILKSSWKPRLNDHARLLPLRKIFSTGDKRKDALNWKVVSENGGVPMEGSVIRSESRHSFTFL